MNPLLKGVLGVGAAGLATVAAGAVVERRVVKTRKGLGAEVEEYQALRGDVVRVPLPDGVVLHCEIDEIAPYSDPPDAGSSSPKRRLTGLFRRTQSPPTLVFVHGYALNLDCWHFQREALRGKHRMVFYDQRSHGRSTRSDRAHATIDQLGTDLATVLDALVPPDEPVVLVGHSMGGMSLMAFAEQHPEVFGRRVAGVALISTSAGGLRPSSIVSPLIPDVVGRFVAPRLIAALASAPEIVDSARARGSNIGFLVADLFAFGEEVPAAQVEFLDQMLADTPIQVLAEFFDSFSALDKYAALARFGAVPTLVLCGTKDRITPISHSRRLAEQIPGSRLVEVEGTGHMVLFEAPDRIEAELERLVAECVPDQRAGAAG